MGKLSEHVIRVANAKSLASWYKTVMGMTVAEDTNRNAWTAFYPGDGVKLVFKEVDGDSKYQASRDSCYWKIGVTVRDVDLARERIMATGTQVSPPNQFMEIGYLCHLADPNGFTIELLQHKFQKNFVKKSPDSSLTLGQPAVIGQITTRAKDIEASLKVYRDILGMKLLSIQDVSAYGFCLYFLAFTDEEPPHPEDLSNVSNREWLWERPYTTLEIQHRPGKECEPMGDKGEGVDHLVMEVANLDIILENLNVDKTTGKYQDPDGVVLRILPTTS